MWRSKHSIAQLYYYYKYITPGTNPLYPEQQYKMFPTYWHRLHGDAVHKRILPDFYFYSHWQSNRHIMFVVKYISIYFIINIILKCVFSMSNY